MIYFRGQKVGMLMIKDFNGKELGRGLIFVICYLFVLPLAISYFAALVGWDLSNDRNYIIANLILYVISLAFLVFYYRKSLKEEGQKYLKNFKTFFFTALKAWGKALLFMFVTNLLIISLLGNIAANESANRNLIGMFPLFSILAMVFLGPFIEELLFRKNFRNVFSSKQAYCLLSGFLFGFAHVVASLDFTTLDAFIGCLPQLLFIIPYGGMGYFFAQAYYDTDSIFTSTTTHMLHNALAVLVSMFGV